MTARREAWLRQARSDFEVAELTEQRGFHSQACYHYGQAAEKALKGLLIALGTLPPYSHSLDRFDATDASMARDASQRVLLFVDQALA